MQLNQNKSAKATKDKILVNLCNQINLKIKQITAASPMVWYRD